MHLYTLMPRIKTNLKEKKQSWFIFVQLLQSAGQSFKNFSMFFTHSLTNIDWKGAYDFTVYSIVSQPFSISWCTCRITNFECTLNFNNEKLVIKSENRKIMNSPEIRIYF